MSTRTKVVIWASAFVIIATVVAIIAVSVTSSVNQRSASGTESSVIRENSHVLDAAEDGKVTLVEFLDFECEACGALYPYVEQLREDYRGQITFVTRYFPIPAHQNSRNAAVAVEAAAQQGKFEEMYRRMFETQATWGESQKPQTELFRSYAEALALDMGKYDSAIADPATAERVQLDFNDGVALGVEGTPSFFLNGEKMTIESMDDFTAQLDAALAK